MIPAADSSGNGSATEDVNIPFEAHFSFFFFLCKVFKFLNFACWKHSINFYLLCVVKQVRKARCGEMNNIPTII